MFVHISAIERAGLRSLNEGQTIEYEIESNRGKESAIYLRVKQRHIDIIDRRRCRSRCQRRLTQSKSQILPRSPHTTAPRITGALVKALDVIAVKALLSHLHPRTERANGG